MTINEYKHPILFYFLCTLIPWSFWFMAAYLGNILDLQRSQIFLQQKHA